MKNVRSCASPVLKHPGRPMLASNFELRDSVIYVKCHETGRYFEARVALARYQCCPGLISIEKDYLPNGETLDLTKENHES